MEREQRLTADTSHQLRTPLAGLRLALEAERAAPRDDPAQVITEALGAVERLEATIDALTDLAREDAAGIELALDAVAGAAVERWRPLYAAAGRILEVDRGAGEAVVSARAAALDTIVDVLLDNALHHGTGTTTVVTETNGGSARIVVADEGTCTLTDEWLFARRSRGPGAPGIGLHLARTLAEAEGARLRLLDQEPTSFQLVLPAADPSRES